MNEHSALEAHTRAKFRLKMAILAAAAVICVFVSFQIGYYPLSPADVVGAFAYGMGADVQVPAQAVTIFWNVRLPRIVAAVLIGASLSVSGAVYQGMFKNPLVSPDILGVSAGASLGAAISIFGGNTYIFTQIFAFVGGFSAVALSYFISTRSRQSQTLSLVLTGMMVAALCNSGVAMIKYVADPNDVLQQLTFWLMGSLAKVNMESVLLSMGPMLAGIIAVFLLRWKLNVLSLSDDEAHCLGVSVKKYRFIFTVASTLMSAAAVCLGGLIGWVGLMIPHICRAIFGPENRRLIPACIIMGAAYLLLMDDIARSLLSMELPIGVITAFVGAPFFVWLIVGRRNS